jgi:glycosyltransferase involved in cell wall biosynthesis
MPSVLLLEESDWGGVHTMTRTLQDALAQANWQVTAVPWRQTHFTQLVSLAKQHDVIVGTHNFGPTYCGAALKALSGKPLVSWVHGPLLDVLHEARTSFAKKMWLRLLYKQVNQFVCVSRTTENSLLGFLGSLHKQQTSTVVPNGLQTLPEGQPLHVHAGHGGESGLPPLLLGYVGRLSAEKQPRWVIDAMRFLPDHAQLGIVGEGPLHRQLVHDGIDLLHQGRVHFLGKHPVGKSLYTPWHITLMASRYEGCPMTALESLACGVPCVALPIPAMRELYDLDAPYLLARGDAPVALAEAVMTVLNLPPEQVQADMARIVERHHVSHFTHGWSKVLHNTVQQHALQRGH